MNEPTDNVDTDGKRKKRWLRFGLRVLLVAMAIVAVTLAVVTKPLRDRKRAINTVRDAGGTFGVSIVGPDWLRRLVGDDECFYSPSRVSLGPIAKDNPELNDAILASVSEALREFPDLHALDVRRSTITDESAPVLASLDTLTHLRLSDTRISDETIRYIKRLPNLQSLLLANTLLTDDCIHDLGAIQTLTSLDIRGTQLTQTAIDQLMESLPQCRIRADP